jgi:hypothetical protein
MFYMIRVKGWPVLVWLEQPPPAGRYDVLATYEDVLLAVAGFYEAVEEARALLAPTGPAAVGSAAATWASWPRDDYSPPGKSMSPLPPRAKKIAT